MPIAHTHQWTAASVHDDYLQAEDDGSILYANASAVTSRGGIVQFNGTIGDGPYGSTSGDFDAFLVQGNVIAVDVDAQILGSGLDAVIEIYDIGGQLVATNDNDPAGGLDPFLSVVFPSRGTYTVVIKGAGSTLSNPFVSSSGTGNGSTGDYRVFIMSSNLVTVHHGTNGDDSITGDFTDDLIVGNGGDDTLIGGYGNDLFVWKAGDGNDRVDGGDLFDVQEINASDNSETFTFIPFFNGPAYIIGMTGFDDGDPVLLLDAVESIDIRALGGNDLLTVADMAGTALTGPVKFWGGNGNDTLDGAAAKIAFTALGEAGSDRLTGGSWRDFLDGGAGRDFLNGGAGRDTLLGGNGNDVLDGGNGNDLLEGGIGNDLLDGGRGNDRLDGGDGSDTLIGGIGKDTLTGGADADRFVFAPGHGTARIADFEDTVDLIDLTAFGFASVAQARSFASNVGSDVVFDFAGGEQLIVENVTKAQITGADLLI